MILAPRKHLYATNLIIFFLIIILQKFITIFCIIEEKACKNKNCSSEKRCDDKKCTGGGGVKTASAPSKPRAKKERNLKVVPVTIRKTIQTFGFGEGHYRMFVEELPNYQPTTTEARLNAADAEKKLNPN